MTKEFGLAKMLRLLSAKRRRARFTETGEGLVFYRPGVGDITKLIKMQAASEPLRNLPAHQTLQ